MGVALPPHPSGPDASNSMQSILPNDQRIILKSSAFFLLLFPTLMLFCGISSFSLLSLMQNKEDIVET